MQIPSPPDPSSPIQHRAPILCVDRILDASETHSLCEFDVRAGPHVTDGHLWEATLVEGLAQCAAVMQAFPRSSADGAAAPREKAKAGVGMLVGIRKFEVLRRPRVGERITWRVDLIRRLGAFLLAEGRASCAGEPVATGELKFYWETAP
jgi:3-hydroxymyristoyl/3-hydroxydecanoyl-(acyl carrier protein) dehydratase